MENYKDKDGRIPEYAIPIAKEILGRLPQGDEVTKRMAELRTGTTQEGHKKAVANRKAKEAEAIKAAKDAVGKYEYNNGQKSYTHSNGVKVTIQQKPDGGLEYFVAK
jgi:hypothetical protein